MNYDWMAGLFDGEGSVLINSNRGPGARKGYVVRCTMGLTDLGAVLLFKNTFGGSFSTRSAGYNKFQKKTLYVWSATGRNARAFLELIGPRLIIKQREADAALAWDGTNGVEMQATIRALRALPREMAV